MDRELTDDEAFTLVIGLEDARTAQIGDLGISTDDAMEAIQRGLEGKK